VISAGREEEHLLPSVWAWKPGIAGIDGDVVAFYRDLSTPVVPGTWEVVEREGQVDGPGKAPAIPPGSRSPTASDGAGSRFEDALPFKALARSRTISTAHSGLPA
jgi:hypothetical protein